MKKLFPIFFILLTVVPIFASADTISELQAKIANLLAQVKQLQAQLSQAQGQQSTKWCHTFNADLKIGDGGDEITALRNALVLENFSVTREGGDKGGNSFDEYIASAVSTFQQKYRSEILTPAGLASPTGYVGGRTRAKLNAIYGCRNAIPVMATPPTTTTTAKIGMTSYIGDMGMKGGQDVAQGQNANFYWAIFGRPEDSQLTYATIQLTNSSGETIIRTITTNATNNFSVSPTYNNFTWVVPTDLPIGHYGVKISYTDYVSGVGKVPVFKWIGIGQGLEVLNSQPADPIIDFFSVNTEQQFSLSARNFSTITLQAQCGNFVASLRSADATTLSYPTGDASICNAPQYYHKSNINTDQFITNAPLNLWNAQGVLDGQTTFISNPTRNSGSAVLIVNVCNTAGKCVQQSAAFIVYPKG
ncbi:MAG: hypothetical protein AAB837_00605 [Patescibacteria group bacterium]|mgnify:CR=1 FL=1